MAIINPKLRYWDSSVFLANIKNESGRGPITEEIIHRSVRGECSIVTSAIALAEVVRPARRDRVQIQSDSDLRITEFFRNPWIKLIDLTPAIATRARELQWRFGLHVRDAVHLASAMYSKAEVLETYDDHFLKLDRTGIPGCPIFRVPVAGQMPLFDPADAEPGVDEP